jgi:hypothetical protein
LTGNLTGPFSTFKRICHKHVANWNTTCHKAHIGVWSPLIQSAWRMCALWHVVFQLATCLWHILLNVENGPVRFPVKNDNQWKRIFYFTLKYLIYNGDYENSIEIGLEWFEWLFNQRGSLQYLSLCYTWYIKENIRVCTVLSMCVNN